MKRVDAGWLVLATAAAILAAGWLLARDGASSSALAAESPTPAVMRSLGEHDFGTLVGAAVGEHELHAANPGPEPWRLVETAQDCGCVAVISATELVPPGEDLVLRVRIETAGQPLGSLEKHVYALVEPGPVRFQGTVTADILPAPHAEPPVVELLVPRGEQRFRGEARIRVPALGEVPAISVQSPAAVRVDVAEGVAAGKLLEFPVSITGELPQGQALLTETIRFRVSRASAPEGELVPLVIAARRPAELQVSPRALHLDLRGDSPAVGRIFVKDASGSPPAELRWREEPSGLLRISWKRARGILEVTATEAPAAKGVQRMQIHLLPSSGEPIAIPIVVSRRLAEVVDAR